MINKLIKWGCLTVLLFIFSSCSFEDVSFKGAENFKLKNISGKTISLKFDAILDNPNKYTINLKPSTFDLHINGSHIGIIHLDEKISIVKRTNGSVSVPVTAELQNGALPKLLVAALQKTASVRIVGTAKGSVSIFSKKKKIDETREIPLGDLNLGLPF